LKKTLVVILSVGLFGCASISDVLPAGKDTYLVGSNVHGGFMSDAEVTGLSVRRANEFCNNQDKQMELINSSNSGTQGWTPQQSQIMFKCTPK
jgi:hypothetical protein